MKKISIVILILLFISPIVAYSATFEGHKVESKKDVESVTSYKTTQLFGTQGDQITMVAEMVALLFAYQGIISFSDVGIAGVTDKPSADAYVQGLYSTIWMQRNALKEAAKKVITDNDLK